MVGHPKPTKPRRSHDGKDEGYLDLIRSLPCVLTGRPAEACHVRYGDLRFEKEASGMGQRPDDRWALPLCPELHRLNNGCQHSTGEQEWWMQFDTDPLAICFNLWACRENRQQMEEFVYIYRPTHPAVIAKLVEILRG